MSDIEKSIDVTEALREEILNDAHRKARRTVERARKRAERAEERARKNAETTHHKIVTEAGKRAERLRRTTLASVEVEVKRQTLKTQGGLVDEVCRDALSRLRARKDDHQTSTGLLNLLVEAVGQMDGGSFVVRTSASDAHLLTDDFLKRAVAEIQTRHDRTVTLTVAEPIESVGVSGGVIVTASDGWQIVDNTFEARLKRMMPELRLKVAGILFGGGNSSNE